MALLGPKWIAGILFRRSFLIALAVGAVCLLLRVGLVTRHGLWADELFSLAMATGHSLEHPAAHADPTQGDYVEAAEPLPVSAYSRYLKHENLPRSEERRVGKECRL